MTEFLDLDRLAELIVGYREKKILITFHSTGDRDSVSSAMVLASCFKDAVVVTPDFITNNARIMLAQVNCSQKIKAKFPKDREVAIVVDANNFEVIGKFKDDMMNFDGEILFIDHHIIPARMPAGEKVFIFNDEKYTAAASIIYELLKRLKVKVTKNNAVLLINGIVSDSADFQNSTSQTFMQISELLGIADTDYSDIVEYFHENMSVENRYALMGDIASAITEIVGRYIIMYGKASVHANVLADTAIRLGADASVFWAMGNSEVSISARLRSPLDRRHSLHLGSVMQDVQDIVGGNGGGHPCAAGLYGSKKENAQIALNEIIKRLKQKLGS